MATSQPQDATVSTTAFCKDQQIWVRLSKSLRPTHLPDSVPAPISVPAPHALCQGCTWNTASPSSE